MREKTWFSSVKRKLRLVCLGILVLCMAISVCSTEAAAKQKKDTIKINKTVYTMKKGKSVKLKVTKSKSAKKKAVVWTSSNQKVATVSSSGKVKAKKNGKTTITAMLRGTKTKAACKIVVGTPVKSVRLNKKSVTIKTGDKFQLKASVSPKKASNKKVTYKSSNPSVAKVSSKGAITALKSGTAKITVTAMDGTGKSAGCTVRVENKVSAVNVSKVSLSETNLSLKPGDTKKVSAVITPANASNKTLVWKSSDEKVVTVDQNGTIKAKGEGTATVKATAHNGISAECSVKSAYSDKPETPEQLEQALSSKMLTHITYSSDAADQIVIPSGDYSNKTLEINAPKAEVNNSGQFEKVVINAIAENTYTENANNIIYFNAAKGRVVVEVNAVATITLGSSDNQSLRLENKGSVNDLHVSGKAELRLEGSQAIPVTLGAEAGDTSIVTSAELRITSSVYWSMTMLPGSENSKASVEKKDMLPSVEGVGYLPVTVNDGEVKDIINIFAETSDNAEITQRVQVTGNVSEYYLTEGSTEDPLPGDSSGDPENPSEDLSGDPENPSEEINSEKKAAHRTASDADIYLLAYTKDNHTIDEENYVNYLQNAKNTKTDENGDFSLSDITVGNYWIVIRKTGYRPLVKSVVITSNNTDTFSCGTSDLISDEIAGCENAPEISGTIIDSLTGNSVNAAGLQVKLRAGANNIIGTAIQTVKTNENGRYTFKDVPAGIYTIEAMDVRQDLPEGEIHYNASHRNIIVANGYLSTDGNDCILDQQMPDSITGKGRVQFTLTWGDEESGASADIDSHLIGPRADGTGTFHVYYSDQEHYEAGERWADLDVDDTDYVGPEHTTIYKETNGIYRFYIHNFSESDIEDSDMLSKSSVQVRVTIGDNSYPFNCPNQKGNLWYVCDYNSMNHTITPRNIMSDFIGSTSDIGLSQEELDKKKKEQAAETAAEAKKYLETRFSDNAARKEMADRIEELEKKAQSAVTSDDIQAAYAELEELCYDLQTNLPVWCSADNILGSPYENSQYQYDEEGNVTDVRRELICSIKFGKELKNFTVEESDAYTTELRQSDDEQYAYTIRIVSKDSGLEQEVFVKVLADQASVDLLDKITQCKSNIAVFEENASILQDLQKLNEFITAAEGLSDEDTYNQILSEIESTQLKYDEILGKFSIVTVSGADGIENWWESSYDIEDEESGAWQDAYAILHVERNDEVTDDDILSKLSVNFNYEDVTFEYVDSDRNGYRKMIKATDGEYTKKIYVSVTEY